MLVYEKLLSIKNYKPKNYNPIVYDTHEEKTVTGGDGVYKVIQDTIEGGSINDDITLVYFTNN
jgi:hypothetical protein